MKTSQKTKRVISDYNKNVMPTYRKTPVVFVRGQGSYLWDAEGKKYLDLFPGWGVSGLGHCPPEVVKAVKDQSGRLMHVSNNYYNEFQGELARQISKASFDGKCFFGNSGAEANEGAIKLARKYGHEKGKYKIITALNSFHGRTLAAITATGQPKYQHGFEPLVPGFTHIPFNDVNALRLAFDDKTCAVMMEVIQGEGGIHVIQKEFINEIGRLCEENDALLIVDEVQTGMGRTGKMFGYQHFNIEPDIMTLAKTLGGGVAIGAMIAQRRIGDVLQPGSHASTFGGNPLACCAALAAINTIQEKRLSQRALKMGSFFRKGLKSLMEEFAFIKEIRGLGLMIGMELSMDGVPLIMKCQEEGLIINCTQGNVLRFLPALTVTESEIQNGLKILRKVFKENCSETAL